MCMSMRELTVSALDMQVLRLDAHGKTRKLSVRRRDLLKEYMLQPRDLRRVDPIVDVNKTSPSITIKENVLLLCLGGVRCGAPHYLSQHVSPLGAAD